MFFPFTNDKQYPEDEWLTIWNLETILLGIVREFSGDLAKMNKQEMIGMITEVIGMYDNTLLYDVNLEQYIEQQYASIIKFLKVDYIESDPNDSTVIMPNETFHKCLATSQRFRQELQGILESSQLESSQLNREPRRN